MNPPGPHPHRHLPALSVLLAVATTAGLVAIALWPVWGLAVVVAVAIGGAAALGFRVRVHDPQPTPAQLSKVPSRRHRPDRHLHSAAFYAETILLLFTIALAIDAGVTQRTYLQLRSGYATVTAEPNNCPVTKLSINANFRYNRCALTFVYAGHTYQVTQPQFEPQRLLVDLKDPSVYMTRANYDNSGTEIIGDVIVVAVLTAAAITVAVFHLLHMRRRRRERDLWRRMHAP